MDDVGKPNVLISTKIARDYPNTDGSAKKVGDSILIGGKKFDVIGLYETGSLVDRHDHRDGDRDCAETAERRRQ